MNLLRCLPIPLLLTLASFALAQDSPLPSRVRSAMQRFVDEKEIAGAVAMVGDADGILALEAVGHREIEGDHPMRPCVERSVM